MSDLLIDAEWILTDTLSEMFRLSDLQAVSLQLWQFDHYTDEGHSTEALSEFIRAKEDYFANLLAVSRVLPLLPSFA